ncbi:MAG: hypothetical protein WAW17_08185 [Rhodococcus sp. (in: high G+C Gram-positive bacteria)]|uniref:hypothetical protein n=1 Tax=Rhodococcus sp. TaxID=1831 RepID=UPI003BB1513D
MELLVVLSLISLPAVVLGLYLTWKVVLVGEMRRLEHQRPPAQIGETGPLRPPACNSTAHLSVQRHQPGVRTHHAATQRGRVPGWAEKTTV